MRTVWKWVIGIVGGLVVLCLLASAFVVPFAMRWGMAAGRRGVQPQTFQHMPFMFGRMFGFGRMGMMGFGGGGLLFFLWQLLLLALVVAGIVFLVRFISRPRAASTSAAVTPASPVMPAEAVVPPATAVVASPAENAEAEAARPRTCASCGRELLADWAHCPYCGAKI
jgi:hypothetical protein